MTLAFNQYVDLLDLHGRAAVRAFAALAPHTRVPPRAERADSSLAEFWGTLEIWLWILKNPGTRWDQREEVRPPGGYEAYVESAGTLLSLLEDELLDVGAERETDFFGRPGTALDVARLLAHEAIERSRAASRASVRREPPINPLEASDGVDRALAHWAEPSALVTWDSSPALVQAADTGAQWWVRFGVDEDSGSIASGSAGSASVTVSGSASALLAWLEGYPDEEVILTGEPAAVHRFRLALQHPVAPPPRRRWWRRQ